MRVTSCGFSVYYPLSSLRYTLYSLRLTLYTLSFILYPYRPSSLVCPLLSIVAGYVLRVAGSLSTTHCPVYDIRFTPYALHSTLFLLSFILIVLRLSSKRSGRPSSLVCPLLSIVAGYVLRVTGSLSTTHCPVYDIRFTPYALHSTLFLLSFILNGFLCLLFSANYSLRLSPYAFTLYALLPTLYGIHCGHPSVVNGHISHIYSKIRTAKQEIISL